MHKNIEILKYIIATLLFIMSLKMGTVISDYFHYNVFHHIDYYQGNWRRVICDNITSAIVSSLTLVVFFKYFNLKYKYQLYFSLYFLLPTLHLCISGNIILLNSLYIFELYKYLLLMSFFLFFSFCYFSFFIKNNFSIVEGLKKIYKLKQQLYFFYKHYVTLNEKFTKKEYYFYGLLSPFVSYWIIIGLYRYEFINDIVLNVLYGVLLFILLTSTIKLRLSKRLIQKNYSTKK